MRNFLFVILFFVMSEVPAQVLSPTSVVVYRKVSNEELKMDIFIPRKQDPSKAAMVLFHGGGWNTGLPSAMHKHAEYFSSRGIVVFVPWYRVRQRNNTTILDAISDSKSAVSWVRKNANKYKVDKNKIIVGGGSAGGYLALNLATEVGAKNNYKPNCLVLFNPVIDLSKDGFGHAKILEELKPKNIDWETMSPLQNIKTGLPPTYMAFGDKDKIISVKTARLFEEEMKEKDNDCTVEIYKGGEHAFFNFGYSHKKGYDKFVQNKYYYEIIQSVDDFLVDKEYLKTNIEIEIPESAIYL